MPSLIRCAGHLPASQRRQTGLEFVGFIDKAREPRRFVEFLSGCDVGCLFSEQEPLGISTLEFLRVGVPVRGLSLKASLTPCPRMRVCALCPGPRLLEVVAAALRAVFRDETEVTAVRAAARAWSPLMTSGTLHRRMAGTAFNRDRESAGATLAGSGPSSSAVSAYR